MKNSFLIIILILFPQFLWGENINIQAENISINKEKEITIFKDRVFIQDREFNSIKSDYAEYSKEKKFLLIKNNIEVIDKFGNILNAQSLDYALEKKILKSIRNTSIKNKKWIFYTN